MNNKIPNKTVENTKNEALMASELKYRRLFEAAQEGILLVDYDDGMILDVNPFLIDLLGYSKADFLEKHLWDIGVLKNIVASKEKFLKLKTQKQIRYGNLPLEAKGGKKIEVEFVSNVYKADGTTVIQCQIRDITQRVYLERELSRTNEENFNNIFNNSADGILLADRESKKFFLSNPSIRKMLGYTEEELKKLSVLDLHLDKDLPYVLHEFERQAKGEITLSRDLPVKKKDGTIFYADISSTTITLAGTKYLMDFFHDNTERKIDEDKLLKSEKKYKALFESSWDAIMTLEPPSWKFTSCNSATINLFRTKDEAEFITYEPWKISPKLQPDGRLSVEKAKEMIEKAMKEGSNYFEWTHRRNDGSDFFASVLLTRVEIEKDKFFLQATVRDITKSKKAEEALKNAKKELEMEIEERTQELENTKIAVINVMDDLRIEKIKDDALLESIGEGVVATDNKGQVILVNKAAEDLLGFTSNEIMGKFFVREVPMQDAEGNQIPDTKRPITLVLSLGKSTTTIMYYFVRRDGIKLPVAVIATPVIIDSKTVGAIIVFRDITKEKGIDRAKTEFVSLASHQLRTPLTSINWYIEMLESGDAGALNDKQKELLSEVHASSRRMVRLVSDLLNVSRLETGRLKIEPVPTDFIVIIQEIVKELEPLVGNTGCQVSLQFPEKTIGKVNIDKALFGQVIENLLTNAIRYSSVDRKGHVTLALAVSPGKAYTIEISDNGIGIPKEAQSHIFERFFRADNARTVISDGNGMGLYLVKKILESCGGAIRFTSEPGQGTTFYVTIPLSGMAAKEDEKGLAV